MRVGLKLFFLALTGCVQISECPNVQISECPHVQMSECLFGWCVNVRMCKCPHLQMSKWNVWMFKCMNIRISAVRECVVADCWHRAFPPPPVPPDPRYYCYYCCFIQFFFNASTACTSKQIATACKQIAWGFALSRRGGTLKYWLMGIKSNFYARIKMNCCLLGTKELLFIQ